MNLGNLLHDLGQHMPGNNFFANNTFGRLISGGIPAAVQRNNWTIPRPGDQTQTSVDDIAGMGSANNNFIRQLSRGAGLAMGGYGLSTLFGGAGAAGGASGGGEEAIPLSEAGGDIGADFTETSPRFGVNDYMRLGQQASNLMGGGGGQGGGGPVDNSMIAPLQISDPWADHSDLQSMLLAMMMNPPRDTNGMV